MATVANRAKPANAMPASATAIAVGQPVADPMINKTAHAVDRTVMKAVAVGCRTTEISRQANGGRGWGGVNNETMFDQLPRARAGSSAISGCLLPVNGTKFGLSEPELAPGHYGEDPLKPQ
jgi:hypothetical protein